MSTPINDGGPAFPTDRIYQGVTGMSLRDWFAGQALNGLLSHFVGVKEGTPQAYANRAYNYADAMLAAREAKP